MTKKFDKDNAVLSYHIYMWNRWSREECEQIFNENNEDWQYSIGEHIWKYWVRFCNEVGATAAPSLMIRDLDTENINKLINRACEIYDGRSLRKNS